MGFDETAPLVNTNFPRFNPGFHPHSGEPVCGSEFQIEVLLLSEVRGPAVIARTFYRETDESRELRRKLAEERKAMPHYEASREGKPSKRDRR